MKHGHSLHRSRTPTYQSWQMMRQRCLYPKHQRYHIYGGRGITICKRWDAFENFLADMGERPKGCTLDRRDNNGNYEPSNCRWATMFEQHGNRTDNLMLSYEGRTQCIAHWARELGMTRSALRYRIVERGLRLDEVYSTLPQSKEEEAVDKVRSTTAELQRSKLER